MSLLWRWHRLAVFVTTVPSAAPEVSRSGFEIEWRNSSRRNVIIYFKVGLKFGFTDVIIYDVWVSLRCLCLTVIILSRKIYLTFVSIWFLAVKITACANESCQIMSVHHPLSGRWHVKLYVNLRTNYSSARFMRSHLDADFFDCSVQWFSTFFDHAPFLLSEYLLNTVWLKRCVLNNMEHYALNHILIRHVDHFLSAFYRIWRQYSADPSRERASLLDQNQLGLFGALMQRVQRWTCNQQVVGLNPTRGNSCVTTLGMLFTPMCLCHQAV